jgi:hypothetical protein
MCLQGASAILEYNTIDSPLAQPRNVILGQLFSSIIGVGMAKLFALNPSFEQIRWVGGALAVGISSAVMGLTKSVHPPAGATALLAVTSNEIFDIGWFLIPLILLGSSLMLGVACVLNNIQRKFPMYWWTPVDLSRLSRKGQDVEKAEESEKSDDGISYNQYRNRRGALIVIDGESVSVPDWISLDSEETTMLEVLRSKIQEGLGATSSRESEATHIPDPSPEVQ